MFVLKHKWPANSTRPFLRRVGLGEPGAQQNTYAFCGLDDATKFDCITELLVWTEERAKRNFATFPDVSIIEVRAVPNPQYEEVRVLI